MHQEEDSEVNSTTERSEVWKFFKKVVVSGKRKALCTVCGNTYAYHGGTTNLHEHLTSKHRLLYAKNTKSAEGTSENTITSYTRSTRCSDARAKEITGKIVNMIALDLRPVNMVEGEGLRSLINYFEPAYKIPCRKHFTAMINSQHRFGVQKLKEKLAKEAVGLSLTTDIWTSVAMEAYMTVTVHFIDLNWSLQEFVLETYGYSERHTGANIACQLQEVAERWTITDKVCTVVHDQAANNILAMKILDERLGWKSQHCTAHCLQLCLKSGLGISTIDRLLGAARKLVAHFHHSVVASEGLKSKQQQMGVDCKKLVTSCATRWNSSYLMLERLLKLRWPILLFYQMKPSLSKMIAIWT